MSKVVIIIIIIMTRQVKALFICSFQELSVKQKRNPTGQPGCDITRHHPQHPPPPRANVSEW